MYYYTVYNSGQTARHNKNDFSLQKVFFSSNIDYKSDAFNIMVRVVICLTNWYFCDYLVMYELDFVLNNNIKVRSHNIKIYFSPNIIFFLKHIFLLIWYKWTYCTSIFQYWERNDVFCNLKKLNNSPMLCFKIFLTWEVIFVNILHRAIVRY